MTMQEVFVCEICSKSFSERRRHTQHKKTHARPHKCHSCPKSFASRTDLTRHMNNVHRVGQTQFRCRVVDCQYKSKRKDNLLQHVSKYHSGRSLRLMGNDAPQANHCQGDGALDDDNQPLNDDCTLKGLTEVLMEASSTGNISLLQNMLDTGLDLNAVTEDGYTAMHCAAKTGQVAMLRYLLGKGAAVDPYNASAKNRRPIHEAITGGHSKAVSVLLSAGCDLLRPDNTNKTVLDHIGLAGDIEITQALFLEENPQISAFDMTVRLVWLNARSGKYSILRWLLARIPFTLPPLDDLRKSPIYLAVLSESSETLEVLLAYYKDNIKEAALANAVSHSFYHAVKRQNEIAAMLLLKHDAFDINYKTNFRRITALHLAANQGNEHLVGMILRHRNVNVNSVTYCKRTPLHEAAEQGHIEALRLLLGHEDVDVQRKDFHGQSALCLAFFACKWKAVRSIMEHLGEETGLDFNLPEGELPKSNLAQFSVLIDHLLDRSLLSRTNPSWRGFIEKTVIADAVELMKSLFIHLDVKVNEPMHREDFAIYRGDPVLHVAAQHHSHDIFALDLDHPQIDVNQKGFGMYRYSYDSVLHCAVRYNCVTALQLLLARPEIDLTCRNRSQETALDLTQKLGRREMFELLLQHGAPGKSTEWDTTIADTTFDAESCGNSKRKVAAPHPNTKVDHSNMEHTADKTSDGDSEDEDMSIDGDSE